jgi:hypothetical protein
VAHPWDRDVVGTLTVAVEPDPSRHAPEGVASGAARVDGSPAGRVGRRIDYLVCAVVAFVPMLWSQPGTVTDDTKTYLYLDPGRYVREALSLWNPDVALGTVTHENIGYLLPMGPFYWLMAELHVPIWVAQRLWLGSLLFAAGAGMLYLCRTIGLTGPGRAVATLAFMFTPYVLQYSGRISVILMPWSGLPWMIAFVVLALRRGGWRYPALFALVVALVSGINASSILYVGVGPVLWIPFAVVVLRQNTWREAWRVVWKVGLLTALVSLWWAVGLQVEAAYGVNILKYTETLESTSTTSTPAEIIRGLGYWFFYGASDQTGPWTQASVAYTQQLWLLGLTFLVPAMAVLAAAVVKWRHRAYFVFLVLIGTVLAVGPYPYESPTGVSGLIKAFMLDTTAGLALRSTDRASPLVILGLAVLLGAGTTAVARRMTRLRWLLAGFVLAVITLAAAPLWTGATVVNGLTQPAVPPPYVLRAVHHLNTTHPGTRVYGLPGNNFAAYRWGDTIDTVYPALLDRPFVTHEQQTMGSLPTADLLEAVDTPLQEGTFDPSTLAPMMSLMSVGDVLVQYDLRYEMYDTPDPRRLALDFAVTPPGLSDPMAFGAPRPNVSTVANVDESELALPADVTPKAPLVTYTVDHPRPMVRAESLTTPLVVAGNSSGLVNASSVGLLSGSPTIFYSGSLDTQAALRDRVLSDKPALVVTDTNRKQGYRWNGITLNSGYTRTASEGPDRSDPFDSPLDLFPGAPADAQSTTVFNGISSVTASSYGSPVQYFNDERPAAALDGDPTTAWATSQSPDGQWWQVRFTAPRVAGSVNLAQLVMPRPRQVITRVELSFGHGRPVLAELGPASRTVAGQTIRFAARTFSVLRVTIIGSVRTQYHVTAGYQNFVGLSEVRIPRVDADETVQMPSDLLRAAGPASQSDPLTLLMDRQRGSGFPPRTDPETRLSRRFWLPTSRSFALAGQARLSVLATDAVLDGVVGRTGTGGSVVVASSSTRLAGDVRAGATAAVDGDPSTAWQTALGAEFQAGAWAQYQLDAPVTFDRMDLQVVTDSQHSVPTVLTVSAGGSSETVRLPALVAHGPAGTVTSVPVGLATPLTGSTVRITVDAARLTTTTDYSSRVPVALPIGIAEFGIPGVDVGPLPAAVPATCRADLLTVDGTPVWVEVTGSSATAVARQPLAVTLCGPDAAGITLGPGDHTVASIPGAVTGLDIDQLAFASAAGGGAAALPGTGDVPAPAAAHAPAVTVVHQTSTVIDLSVSGVRPGGPPFALVLGQSLNAGWQATVGGQTLAAPGLIDGFANGWTVDPAVVGSAVHDGTLAVTLRWAPQRRVNAALLVSAAAIVLCLWLAVVPTRRRRRRRAVAGDPDPVLPPAETSVVEDPERTEPPVLIGVPTWGGEPTPWPPTVVVAVVVAVVAGAIASPLTGLVAGAAAACALRKPAARRVVGLAAAALMVVAGADVVLTQWLDPVRATGGWPVAFGVAGDLVWAAVLLLATDAAVELVLRYRAGHGTDPAPAPRPDPAPAPHEVPDVTSSGDPDPVVSRG